MKKLILLWLVLGICLTVCTAFALEDMQLLGTWSAVKMSASGGEIALSGKEASNAGLFFSINPDGNYTTLAYAGGQILTYQGKYELTDEGRLVLDLNDEKALCDIHLDGDALVITELGAGETAAYFERCDASPICGYWRSVSMNAGSGEIDIDDSQNVGMSLYFRADGSCTGIIISNGKSSARDMTYLASSDTIALVEPNAVSFFTYRVEGDTMVCVFTSADGSTSIAYTLIR